MVSENLLVFAADQYGFDRCAAHFISESTNQIYSFQKGGKWYILRFAERPAEQMRQVKAEMDWLYYLAKHQVHVSLPLADVHNQLVGTAENEGKSYLISAFEALPGKFWNRDDPELWNAQIFYHWGKAMGDIHRLTKDYSPANDRDVRGAFTGHNALFLEKMEDCPMVCGIAEDLINEILALPKDRDSYGLIHYDIHPWNFIIENGQVNVFDFDDSLYGWFALDIGIALYHGLWWGRTNAAGQDFTNDIIKHFLRGYLTANPLDDFWLAKIPLFMKYRQICKLSWFYTPGGGDEHQRERIRNIENDVLFTGCQIEPGVFANSK